MQSWQLQPEEVVAGRYRVIRALGSRRYVVESLQDKRSLVLSVLALDGAESVSRFEAHAAQLGRLRHPRLASYVGHSVVERGDGYWGLLLQELAQGSNLADWIANGAQPSEDRVVRFAEQLLSALVYLHEQTPPALVGRLEPESVVLSTAGELELVAFGDLERLETAGQAVRGAVGYLAPEELRGQRGVTSDLYALGALLVFLLTRRSPAELPQREGRIDLRSVKASKWLSPVLERLLHLEPTRRFPSARSVSLALKRKSAPISFKRMGLLALVLTLVVALPAVGIAWYTARPKPQPVALPASGSVKLPPRLPPGGAQVVRWKTYSGHLGPVSNLAWLPDNAHFISGGRDGALKLWHKDHEEPLRSFKGGQGSVLTLSVDPHGKYLAVGGRDGQLRIWSIETGEVLRSIPDSPGGIHDLDFSGDGKLLASTGRDGVARLHDPETGKLTRRFKLAGPGLAVAFSPDGTSFATSCYGTDIKIWDRNSGQELFTLKHGANVNDLKFTADGAGLISVGDDKRIVVWNIGQRGERHVIEAHRDEAWRIALNEKSGLLATGGKGHLLVISDPFKGEAIQATFGGSLGFPALAYSPDGQNLIGGGAQQEIWLFHAEKSTWFPEPVLTPPPPPKFSPPPEATPAATLAAEGIFELRERPDQQGLPRAIRLLEKAEAVDSDDPTVLELGSRVAQAQSYVSGTKHKTGGLALARALIDHATRVVPDNPDFWRRVANVAIAQKKLGDAVAAAAKARALDPDSVWQRRLELVLAEKQGAAREHRFRLARGLVEADPNDLYGLDALLEIYRERGEWDAVEAIYKSKLVLQPSSAWTAGNFANFYIERRRPKAALAMIKRALAIMDYGMGHRLMGDALLEQAHQELRSGAPRSEVEKLVAEAEKQRASASRVLFVRGLLAWTAGEFAEASALFKRAVDASKHYDEARDALTWKPGT